MRRFLVVSDLHLADLEDHADGWKAHKASKFSIDGDFGELVGDFVGSTGESSELVLVLNGDIFDFDLITAVPEDPPWPVTSGERKRGLNATADKSAWKLQRMLADHSGFVDTLADFLIHGNQLIYVMGNHDREFHFPEVQAAFLRAIREAVAERGGSLPAEAVQFEPWFYYVPGVIYAEHGQQYDYYNSFKFILAPEVLTQDGPVIALPMGNLSNRYLVNRMGFFNPHAGDFILNVFHYALHWLRHYAFSRRSILFNWFWGSMLVMSRLAALKKYIHRRPADYDGRLNRSAQHANISRGTIRALANLHRPPITTRFYRIFREFWIDRLILAIAMTVGTVLLAVSPIPLWIKLMVPLSSFPLIYFIYEWFARGETIFTMEHEIPKVAMKIAGILPAKVITFGHTHRPRIIPLIKNASFVDTGTWAPITTGDLDKRLVPGYRNYLIVDADGSAVRLSLGSWMKSADDRAAAVESVPVRLPLESGTVPRSRRILETNIADSRR